MSLSDRTAPNHEAVYLARTILLFSFILTLFLPTLSFAENFTIYTEEYPPYNYTDNGSITGISTEIVREILHRINHLDTI